MVINKNLTLRRKRRPLWYGMLCLVLITAAVSTVSLIPSQSNDISSAESVGIYTLSGGGHDDETIYNDLKEIIDIINESEEYSVFTITVKSNDTIISGITLSADKTVTLTSSSGNTFTLTIEEENERHLTVFGTLTLENIIFDGNKAGGGIQVEIDGTLTMNKGTVIQNCSAYYVGGGVYNDGTFIMNGGKISGNATTKTESEDYGEEPGEDYGGGVYNTGEFTMNGGKISGNHATNGGGVCNDQGGIFTMSGGKISGNTADRGGGVHCYRNDTFTMSGGEISGNHATKGGGVYVVRGTFNMEGGGISGNTATNGGGVYNAYGCTFTMKGGKINKNTSTNDGGGVYSYDDNTFTMKGGEINENTSTADGGGVYIYYDCVFTIKDGMINDNVSKGSGGGVYIYIESRFFMDDGEISGNHAANGGGVYNEDLFIMTGGEISGNTASNDGGGVYNDGSITMEGGVISDNEASNNGGGVYNAGSFTMKNGVIGDNTAIYGGGIYTTYYYNLTVNDGVVFSGNTASTLRTANIDDNTLLTNYKNKIGDKVVLNAPVKPGLNAPALNNYDINYTGDAYVVTIVIDPYGGGDVAAKDKGKDTVKAKGYVYVYIPLSGDEITLSATPKKGYEFTQFIIGETESFDKSITLVVTGNVEVIAEFLRVSTQPEQKDYFITATADDGSTISPSGTVTVPYGENKTFLFSAKPGYQIKAVFVNGVAISSTELASGAYTFSNVMSNHTISVVSEVEAGSGGDVGGDGSDGTGSGPDVSGSDNLYVIGIICAMLVVIAGAVVFVWRRGYFGSNNE